MALSDVDGAVSASAVWPTLLQFGDLPQRWSEVEPLLARACSYSRGEYTPEVVVLGMEAGALEMLALDSDAGLKSLMVTAISRSRSGMLIFDCLLVSGVDMDSWRPFEPQMDEYARARGCSKVRMIGRKGFTKRLPHWDLAGWVMERDLGG